MILLHKYFIRNISEASYNINTNMNLRRILYTLSIAEMSISINVCSFYLLENELKGKL